VQLRPCGNPALTNDALCGKYDVFEDRTAKSGRKISLNIVLLPAAAAKPQPDPIFYLAGGPGAGATSYAPAQFMQRLRRDRDVVLVDQRGTGASNPLNCDVFGGPKDMQPYFADPFPVEKLRACRVELEQVANLKLYTTSLAMDDLDDLRAALGYDRVNIYGGSYGSLAALVYLRQHGDRVRTVTGFGVAPPDAKVPLSFARGVQHAMDRLFIDCAADSKCKTAFPELRSEFEAVLAKFDKRPLEVSTYNVFTSQPQTITLGRAAFVDSVRMLLYAPTTTSALPLLIHLAAAGNPGPLLANAFQVMAQIDKQLARGMQLSVLCAEDIPFITETDITRESAGSFYGDIRVRATMKACAEWPRANVPASFLDPIKSDVPVLLVSGELDAVTPPSIAEATVRNFLNGRQLKVTNASHFSYECVENVIATFIEKGTTQGLDTSCLEQIRRPPFNLLPTQ
jgi:pimeloyl-ACP methyl ester carboxylesterase